MVSLKEFTEKIAILDKRARFDGPAGLGAMYQFIDGMSLLNRLLLKVQIQIYYAGAERAGYLSTFAMHDQMKKVLSDDTRT